ncbi:MAG: hypothetical protein O0X96_05585 [Methanocorpusculum sp.]|nr:hypothetical protein [Methanocorpusculum sp.]
MVEPISCILGVALIQVVFAIVGVVGALNSMMLLSLLGLGITLICSVYIIKYFLKDFQKDMSKFTPPNE